MNFIKIKATSFNRRTACPVGQSPVSVIYCPAYMRRLDFSASEMGRKSQGNMDIHKLFSQEFLELHNVFNVKCTLLCHGLTISNSGLTYAGFSRDHMLSFSFWATITVHDLRPRFHSRNTFLNKSLHR